VLEDDTLLTVQQLTEFTQLSRVTIWREVREGRLKAVRTGRSGRTLRFKPADVREWLSLDDNAAAR
jgi:excisionase family DNA binding protein